LNFQIPMKAQASYSSIAAMKLRSRLNVKHNKALKSFAVGSLGRSVALLLRAP
jgi:hypothetical protein